MKKFTYKVYDASENFITTWTDVISEPNYSREVNSAGIELVIKLARNVLDYGEDDDVKFGNIIKIYCEDREYTTPTIIYQGYITNYRPVFETPEYIEVVLYSFGAELANYILQEDEVANQTQATGSSTINFGGGDYLAQSFIPSVTSLSSIVVKLAVGVPTNVNLTLQTDNAGQPSGTVVTGSSVTKYITDTTASEQRFIFASNVTVGNGTTYWIVLQ